MNSRFVRRRDSLRAGYGSLVTEFTDELASFVGSRDDICVAFDRRLEVLASNEPARQAWSAFTAGDNMARAVFLDPEFDRMLELSASPIVQVVELLRTGLAGGREDAADARLIGELSAQSAVFSRLWATPVPLESRGTIRIQVGDSDWISYDYEIEPWHPDSSVRLMTWHAA